MALTNVTTTFNLKDYLGETYKASSVRVYLTTNAEKNLITDKSTGEVRLGGGTVTLAADGSVSATHWAPGVDANPASWQTTYRIDFVDTATKKRQTTSIGPFTVTASGLLSALIDEQAVPATYLTTVTQQLDTKVAEAEAAAQLAVDISNITVSDDVMAAAMDIPGGAFATKQSASIDGRVDETLPAKVQTETDAYLPVAGAATFVRLGRQTIDVRDHGVIGDGTSRPLSSLYPTLAAAQADYPQAQALTEELDYAALQSMSYAHPGARFLIPNGLSVITNRAVDVLSKQKWQIDGDLTNIHPRNTPVAYQDAAHCFRVGNMHPIVCNTADPDAWAAVGINTVSPGQRSFTITTPADVTAAGVTIAPGDFVWVRSNSNPVAAGNGTIYDFQQLCKVTAYDAGTGVVSVERPIEVGITGGKVVIDNGVIDETTNPDRPFYVVDEVVVEGHGKLSGATPFGYKTGAYKPRLSVRGDFQDALSLNAIIAGDVEVRDGTFTSRALEAKQACQDSKLRVRSEWVLDAGATPRTVVSIGEQAFNLDVILDLTRGPDYPSNLLALDVWGQNIRVRGTYRDYAKPAGMTHSVQVRSIGNAGRPPSDIDLTGLVLKNLHRGVDHVRYMQIGTDAGMASPTRIKAGINAKTIDGAGPTYLAQVGAGTEVDVRGAVGDVRRVNVTGTGEVPEEGSYMVGTVAGATYAANSETLVGTLTLQGVKVGDHVDVSLQQIGGVSAGTLSDLIATATVNGTNSIRVYLRNRSATAITTTGTPALWMYATWRRRRV